MPLTTITATLDNTIRCTFNELCSQQSTNYTQDASISFTTLLTASSTLMATIYAAASSSLTLSSYKLYSFYSKQRLNQLIQSNHNLTFDSNLIDNQLEQQQLNTSPTQSEIVSITGALIVFTFLLTTVLLTHLFDAIDDFTRKCCKFNFKNLIQIGVGKKLRQSSCFINQLILDLIITIILKSTILTSLFIDEKNLRLNKKLDYNYEHNLIDTNDLQQLIDYQFEDDDIEFDEQRKWSSWFALKLKKRLLEV